MRTAKRGRSNYSPKKQRTRSQSLRRESLAKSEHASVIRNKDVQGTKYTRSARAKVGACARADAACCSRSLSLSLFSGVRRLSTAPIYRAPQSTCRQQSERTFALRVSRAPCRGGSAPPRCSLLSVSLYYTSFCHSTSLLLFVSACVCAGAAVRADERESATVVPRDRERDIYSVYPACTCLCIRLYTLPNY